MVAAEAAATTSVARLQSFLYNPLRYHHHHHHHHREQQN
jgi:hypothetical protein